MNTWSKTAALAASLLVGLGTTTALAGGKTPVPGALPPPVAAYTKATLAALIGPDGTIYRQKGVLSVTHNASSGIYCIFPGSATVIANLSKITPVVSTDYGTSPDLLALAQYDSHLVYGGNCPSNAIQVNTYNIQTANYQDEGFTILVW